SIAKSFASLLIFDAADGGPLLMGGSLEKPVALPRLQAFAPAGVATTAKTSLKAAIPGRAAVERARTINEVARVATVSQLPSDRPTPRRVWVIASVLLVALAVLLLLLFRNSHRESEDAPTESMNRHMPPCTSARPRLAAVGELRFSIMA